MKAAIISGDIIAYTSLNKATKNRLEKKLFSILKILKKDFNVYGRIIKGDYIECYIPNIKDVLRVNLIIKTYIKAFAKEILKTESKIYDRIILFEKYGIRTAIGIGELSRLDLKKGIIDGEAIYFSGRIINNQKNTYDRNKISIKNTLFIKTDNDEVTKEFIPLLLLTDEILNRNTAKQSEILFYKLLGFDTKSISKKIGRSQSTISQHSTSSGWNAIEKSVLRFEEVINNKY